MSSKIIAVIDDEAEMEDIYSLILEPLIDDDSIEMKFFEDFREFLKWFENHTPDLVFCDINMPYMDGIALCRRIREAQRTVEIALVSGDHPREHIQSMKDLGISRFISKPVSPQEILNLCNEQIAPQPAIS